MSTKFTPFMQNVDRTQSVSPFLPFHMVVICASVLCVQQYVNPLLLLMRRGDLCASLYDFLWLRGRGRGQTTKSYPDLVPTTGQGCFFLTDCLKTGVVYLYSSIHCQKKLQPRHHFCVISFYIRQIRKEYIPAHFFSQCDTPYQKVKNVFDSAHASDREPAVTNCFTACQRINFPWMWRGTGGGRPRRNMSKEAHLCLLHISETAPFSTIPRHWAAVYTVKKVSGFPVPSWDATNQPISGRE